MQIMLLNPIRTLVDSHWQWIKKFEIPGGWTSSPSLKICARLSYPFTVDVSFLTTSFTKSITCRFNIFFFFGFFYTLFLLLYTCCFTICLYIYIKILKAIKKKTVVFNHLEFIIFKNNKFYYLIISLLISLLCF